MLTQCVCGSRNDSYYILLLVKQVPLVTCEACGVLRVYDVDPETYLTQYRDGSYHQATTPARLTRGEGSYAARFEHDQIVAKSRLRVLARWHRAGRLLDVGCSNGAFVQQANEAGFDALGTDLSLSVYQGASREPPFLGGIAASDPSWRGTFSVITYHDVLEHCLDPVSELAYARALLAPDGMLVLELPDMAEPGTERHIKPDEHLWHFTAAQLLAFLDANHWRVHHFEHPVPGKLAVYASPATPKQEVHVYVPPGIGDQAWVIPKIAAIRALHEPCTVAVHVSALSSPETVRRSEGYLALFPCIDRTDFDEQFPFAADLGQLMEGQPVYQLYPNKHVEDGKPLRDWHPQWKAPAVVPMFIPAAVTAWAERYVARRPKPVLLFFCSSRHYYAEFQPCGGWTARHWARLMACVQYQYDITLVGSEWDRDYAEEIQNVFSSTKITSLVGDTTVAELIALARAAVGVIGVACGVTILSTYAGVPTVALWPVGPVSTGTAVFTEGFQTAWVSWQQQQHYRPLPLATSTPEDVLRAWLTVIDSWISFREVA